MGLNALWWVQNMTDEAKNLEMVISSKILIKVMSGAQQWWKNTIFVWICVCCFISIKHRPHSTLWHSQLYRFMQFITKRIGNNRFAHRNFFSEGLESMTSFTSRWKPNATQGNTFPSVTAIILGSTLKSPLSIPVSVSGGKRPAYSIHLWYRTWLCSEAALSLTNHIAFP